MENTLILASFGRVAFAILMVFIALLLIFLILLQKNRGSGLSGAFGGVGGHTAFGTKTGDFLTWITVGLTAFFLILGIVGNYLFDESNTPSAAIAAPTTPAAPTGATSGGAAPSTPTGATPMPITPTPIPDPTSSVPAPTPSNPAPSTPSGNSGAPSSPSGTTGSPSSPSPAGNSQPNP